jgi:ankyrin repeat protein
LTPLESAAAYNDEKLLEVLFSYGADLNKTYYLTNELYGENFRFDRDRGALSILLTSSRTYYDPHWPSLAIIRRMFEAGAEVLPGIVPVLANMEGDLAFLIILHILPSKHADFFQREFWAELVSYGEDL